MVALGAAVKVIRIVESTAPPGSSSVDKSDETGGAHGMGGAVPPSDVRTLHYVSQLEPASDLFNRFLQALSVALSHRPDLNLQYHATLQSPYTTVGERLSSLAAGDAVIVVAKELERKPQDVERLKRVLKRNPRSNLIFVDRAPPKDLLREFPNTCYIGINNARVGVIAGAVVWKKCAVATQRAYVVVAGPGGPDRANWFLKTVKALDPSAPVEKVAVRDEDRIDTQDRIRGEQHRLMSAFPHHTIGLFAGNDETATSVCHQAMGGGFKRVCVVGCDATREMRQWVENEHSIAVATIYNDLYTDETIETILSAMTERVTLALDPRLFPASDQSGLLADARDAQLWNEAAWTG